jgi:hypothetical protein
MLWSRLPAYVTGTVNQELLLRNEYLAAENRILRGQIKGSAAAFGGRKGDTDGDRILLLGRHSKEAQRPAS